MNQDDLLQLVHQQSRILYKVMTDKDMPNELRKDICRTAKKNLEEAITLAKS